MTRRRWWLNTDVNEMLMTYTDSSNELTYLSPNLPLEHIHQDSAVQVHGCISHTEHAQWHLKGHMINVFYAVIKPLQWVLQSL